MYLYTQKEPQWHLSLVCPSTEAQLGSMLSTMTSSNHTTNKIE